MPEHEIIHLIQSSGKLPPMPKDFGEILGLLLKPTEYDVDQCVEYFSQFPKLESLLLEVLSDNSKIKIKTTKDAINYLGAKKAKLIAIAYATRLLLSYGRAKIFDKEKYWKHCLGTAFAAYIIASETQLVDKDRMFTYGLLHDIGTIVLDICLPEQLDKIDEMHQKGVHQIVSEKIVLKGITHSEVGQWLCKEWGLPDEILDMVALHHYPLLATRLTNEIRILHLADAISTNYYERLLGNHTTFVYADKMMEALNVKREFIEHVIEILPKEIENLNRIIHI